MKKKMLGKEKYLKEIEAVIPHCFNELNSSKTLYLEPKIVSDWAIFGEVGFSIKKKDFIGLMISINGINVELDKTCRHYFSYQNKRYLGFGHPKNKKGILIKLTDTLWNSIKEKGYFEIVLDWELAPNLKMKPYFSDIKVIDEKEEGIEIAFAGIYAKVHVKDVESGEHLAINHNTPRMAAYFNKNDAFIKDENLDIDYFPRSLNLANMSHLILEDIVCVPKRSPTMVKNTLKLLVL